MRKEREVGQRLGFLGGCFFFFGFLNDRNLSILKYQWEDVGGGDSMKNGGERARGWEREKMKENRENEEMTVSVKIIHIPYV